MSSIRATSKSKKPTEPELIEELGYLTSDEFKTQLAITGPNLKHQGIPLLHLVIRSSGPKSLQAMLEAKVDVNLLTEQPYAYSRRDDYLYFGRSSALQWITGMLVPTINFCGWPDSYKYCSGGALRMSMTHEHQFVDKYTGSANEIMHQIADILIQYNATIDFYSACALGRKDIVETCISENPDIVNLPGPDGASPLAWAARRGQSHIIHFLLEKKANVNQVNEKTKLTPLEDAIKFHGTTDAMDILLKAGAEIRKGVVTLAVEYSLEYFEKLDFILSRFPASSSLVTFKDMQSINNVKYNENLQYLAKYKISLTEVDGEIRNKEGHGLIFCGYNTPASTLRLLISLGCSTRDQYKINDHQFTPDFINKYFHNNPIVDSYPLSYQAYHLSSFGLKEYSCRDEILEKMAVLFFHGSPVETTNSIQKDPLKNLCDDDFKKFLTCLDKEITENKAYSDTLESKEKSDLIKQFQELKEEDIVRKLEQSTEPLKKVSFKWSHIEALEKRKGLLSYNTKAAINRKIRLNMTLFTSTKLFASDCNVVADYVGNDIEEKDIVMSLCRI